MLQLCGSGGLMEHSFIRPLIHSFTHPFTHPLALLPADETGSCASRGGTASALGTRVIFLVWGEHRMSMAAVQSECGCIGMENVNQ